MNNPGYKSCYSTGGQLIIQMVSYIASEKVASYLFVIVSRTLWALIGTSAYTCCVSSKQR